MSKDRQTVYVAMPADRIEAVRGLLGDDARAEVIDVEAVVKFVGYDERIVWRAWIADALNTAFGDERRETARILDA